MSDAPTPIASAQDLLYEDEASWSNFLVISRHCSTPSVEVELWESRAQREAWERVNPRNG
jgi:hypothetical protein